MRVKGPIPPHILERMSKADRPKGKAGMTTAEIVSRDAVRRERELHDQVAAMLRLNDIVFCHARMDRKSTITEGWPDYTFAVCGNACAIECKLPGQVLSEAQAGIKTRMVANGWRYCIAYDLEHVRGFLAKIPRRESA